MLPGNFCLPWPHLCLKVKTLLPLVTSVLILLPLPWLGLTISAFVLTLASFLCWHCKFSTGLKWLYTDNMERMAVKWNVFVFHMHHLISQLVTQVMASYTECSWGKLSFSFVNGQWCVFYFYFYELLVDSALATRRIGEQKFSCLQFASSTHNVKWASRWKLLCFCANSVLMWMIVVLFYFYSRRNKSQRYAACLFINVTVDRVPWQRTVDRVPWQRSFCEILRGSCLSFYRRFLTISCIAKQEVKVIWQKAPHGGPFPG